MQVTNIEWTTTKTSKNSHRSPKFLRGEKLHPAWMLVSSGRPSNKQDFGNSRYHHLAAPLYGEIGDNVNEIKHYRLAVAKNHQNANARNDLGLALMRQGKLDLAEREVKGALDINPDNGLALNNMAAVLARKGKFSKAQEYCEKAIKLNPNDAMAHRNLAKIMDTLGNTRDAVKHNRIAIQLGPGQHGVTQVSERAEGGGG